MDSGLKITSIQEGLAIEMSRCFDEADISEWMTKEQTTLVQEDPHEGTAPNNYRLITMIWKILTAQISEEIYKSLISR